MTVFKYVANVAGRGEDKRSIGDSCNNLCLVSGVRFKD